MSYQVSVATVDEVQPGERLLLEVDGLPLAVFNVNGEFFCVADLCSHDDGPIGEGDLEGHDIICPRHGARFDLRTGKVLSFPAIVGIPAYPVTVTGGEIAIELPD